MFRLFLLWVTSFSAFAAEPTLYLYNWNNHIGEETLARFAAQCRCRVKQDYDSDNEEMLAKLEAGASGYDLIVPTGNAVESLLRRGALAPLDKARLPHLANLKPEFADPWYDRGNRDIFPAAADLPRLEMLRDFDAGLRRRLSRMWTEIKVR